MWTKAKRRGRQLFWIIRCSLILLQPYTSLALPRHADFSASGVLQDALLGKCTVHGTSNCVQNSPGAVLLASAAVS